jgi:hypothetical protein
MSSSTRHHRDDVCLERHSRETHQDLQIKSAEENKGQMVSREQSSAAMHDDVIGWYARPSCDGVVTAIASI